MNASTIKGREEVGGKGKLDSAMFLIIRKKDARIKIIIKKAEDKHQRRLCYLT
jgi:hypothetical protein